MTEQQEDEIREVCTPVHLKYQLRLSVVVLSCIVILPFILVFIGG